MDRRWLSAVLAAALVGAVGDPGYAAADGAKPSRPPQDGCAWEKLSDAKAGFAAWVQRCDFGFRKIHFEFVGRALSMVYSDGGDPEPLVESFDVAAGETPEAAVERIFVEHTGKALAARCLLAPDATTGPPPAGVARYTFVPDEAFQKELDARANPDEVPDPPCGDWGTVPDGIQYFQAPSADARKVLFVRVGQDTPLFDEQTLRLLPAG